MLIRSQDRESLMPIGAIECGKSRIENTFDGISVVLGKYESEPRCLEILDEIEERLIIREGRSDVYNMPEK